jgi:ABC-2 type transport system ATP-binding protein
MSNVTIDCQKLTKRYGRSDVYALHELSLQVQSGEVYGYLGPNGAGKSTTIRTLLNFIQPTSGNASILGLDIVKDSRKIKGQLGYLSGELSLYHRMTGNQFLDYMAALQPPKHLAYRKRLVGMFDVSLDQPLKTLSKGNKQKIGIIQAFMHEPRVLILDEPTSGLDPLMQEAFFSLVREVQDSGAAVFVSSHNFSEVTRMCDRVGFIRSGKLVGEESITALQARAAHNFVITFKDTAPLAELKKIPHATVKSRDERHVHVELQGELTPLFKVLAAYHVLRLDQQEADLEKEFLRFYKGGNV